MKLYNTITEAVKVEYTIEKSKFIAYLSPANTREEAEDFIKSIRKKHYDATHNVPAMIIGENKEIKWSSDDGEPSGTAGLPMLQTLEGHDLRNVVLVITRYFGGIKLGTGGLVRAYTEGAKGAIDAAKIFELRKVAVISFECDYSTLEMIKASQGDFSLKNIQYSDKVKAQALCELEELETVEKSLINISKARINILDKLEETVLI
ncbi:MAG: YigZ family protein [Clostridia bacterium]|nr:YigZ family protein [Clostridia bacterium]